MKKHPALRWSAALLLVASIAGSTGCASMRAAFNPSAAWAIREPTPLVVVMDRSQTATELSTRTAELLRTLPVQEATAEALVMHEPQARTLLEQGASESPRVQQPVRVVTAEAWTRKLTPQCMGPEASEAGEDLMSTLGPEAATAFDEVDAKVRKLAELKAEIVELRAQQRRAKGEAKAPFAETIKAKKEVLGEAKKELKPELDALLEVLAQATMELDADRREQVSGMAYNLLAAVKDGETANAAATVRYPLAMTKILDDIQARIPELAADVVLEQTGQRPDLTNLSVQVKLEEGKVKLELAGVDAQALGKLDPAGLVKETTLRTQAYVTRAFTLPGELNQTAERLRFQHRVLAAITKQLPPPTTGVTDLKGVRVSVTPSQPTATAAATDAEVGGESAASSCGQPPAQLAAAATTTP